MRLGLFASVVDRLRDKAKNSSERIPTDAEASARFFTQTGFWSHRPSSWSLEEIERLQSLLGKLKGVQRAYLVERFTRNPRHDHSCLVLEHGGGLVNPKAILDRFEGDFDGLLVLLCARATAEVRAIPEALVYVRAKGRSRVA